MSNLCDILIYDEYVVIEWRLKAMDYDALWDFVKDFTVLSFVSAVVIILSGGKGWVGYAEYAVMGLMIIYMKREAIKKLIFEYVEE